MENLADVKFKISATLTTTSLTGRVFDLLTLRLQYSRCIDRSTHTTPDQLVDAISINPTSGRWQERNTPDAVSCMLHLDNVVWSCLRARHGSDRAFHFNPGLGLNNDQALSALFHFISPAGCPLE